MIIDSPFEYMETSNVIALYPKGIDVGEFISLIRTMDLTVCKVFDYTKKPIDPRYYIRLGKVEAVREFLEIDAGTDRRISGAIIYDDLKPSQVFNLENIWGIKVITRHMLILHIFLHHARMKEARLQVEYAILNYQRPYVRELVRRSKRGEHPGYMAGGEYLVDEYYRLINKRLKKIRTEMQAFRRHRTMIRMHRKRRGFYTVSLAGYTNAGKSSIFRLITRERVVVDDRLFSTLSTKTRRLRDKKVLVSDTVGFIKDIPPQFIEAFHATLEEITSADLIVLVVDLSDPEPIIREKLRLSLDIIMELAVANDENNTIPVVIAAFNKVDLVPEAKEKVEYVLKGVKQGLIQDYVITSALTEEGKDDLIRAIEHWVIK